MMIIMMMMMMRMIMMMRKIMRMIMMMMIKDITIGPTAIMALMTSVHAQYGPQYAVLLSFLSGIIILLCGLLQLGFLIDNDMRHEMSSSLKSPRL